MQALPILYSFRRCPYAIRARLALASAGAQVQLREIVLKDKAPELVAASPKATVPVLVTPDGNVIEESLDIMRWSLAQRDPERWLPMPAGGQALIDQNDGPFKAALDRTKYADRYDGDPEEQRSKANHFLYQLAQVGRSSAYLFGARPTLADVAIMPFVRQFAFVDRARFDAEAPPWIRRWLDGFLASDQFAAVMIKYPRWRAGDAVTRFPA